MQKADKAQFLTIKDNLSCTFKINIKDIVKHYRLFSVSSNLCFVLLKIIQFRC